jgi:UrcA family protein
VLLLVEAARLAIDRLLRAMRAALTLLPEGHEEARRYREMRRILPMIAIAAGALLAAQPALAESVKVAYDDLDLSTPKGQKELKERIDAAAKKICGIDDVRTGTRLPSSDSRTCLRDTKQQIQHQLAAVLDQYKAGGGKPANSPAGANSVP